MCSLESFSYWLSRVFNSCSFNWFCFSTSSSFCSSSVFLFIKLLIFSRYSWFSFNSFSTSETFFLALYLILDFLSLYHF
ncbi:hypothetical protein MCCG_0978 [Mycoplasma capricolum subsp. capripneumoniae 87001]|uniref:Uncharacterized protein n=1 Tax=Mycoplasma capricolum subsp. capripneumoniae 87001 TaxID=1124992 RepID=A0A9N7G9S9_MYCCC|nr:hypothetical protein MCCG_0978 [Mycoplasma capricolum subsp. capripneumoniae 87001]